MPARSTPPRPRRRGRHARPRPRRRRLSRWSTRTATAFSALVLTASGIGHAMVSGLDAELRRVDPFHGLSHRPRAGDGTNFLVVGTDGRAGIGPADRRRYSLGGTSCHCTDTIMLVHLSADRSRASVVSIPRDSYTEFPGHTDPATGKHRTGRTGKINAAYAYGGPRLTVRTVEKMTGVRVDHYLEVDFTSFMRTVDALGGVPVCTARPLRDPHSGLDLPAGTTRLDGGRALQYVRARQLDGEGDLGRIRRQQHFLASMINEATRRGVLMNPVRLNRVVSALVGSVRADPGLDTGDLVALGRAMRGLTAASSEFVSVPVADPDRSVPGIGSTVVWDKPEAEGLFRAMRRDLPLAAGPAGTAGGKNPEKPGEKAGRFPRSGPLPVEADPAKVRVQVENGTPVADLGMRVDRALRATGFDTTGTPRAAKRQDLRHTTVHHGPGQVRAARALAAALPGARLREDKANEMNEANEANEANKSGKKGKGDNREGRDRDPVLRVVLGKEHSEVRQVRERGSTRTPERKGTPVVTGDEVVCPRHP
ncbi:LytR family transcriptional regulator [Streptomyces carminius]|uniref:LytR family transcriptional regulator n=1 Tax=Streptomyces carminius TaxID=2665496 RepID=A0A2M8LUI9_9ACTN|nr:LCP family protein [Streptomyces carminius]PJE95631.1 LytR family transcriptional regulator [Streptomyces carminius]